MPRFFIDPDTVGERVRITGEDAGHITRTLRMKPGEQICLCDGAGMDYTGRIVALDGVTVDVQILSACTSEAEPDVRVALYISISKGEKMEMCVQKAVELGASEVVPVMSARCVSRPDEKTMEKKVSRWQKIAAEAAKQAGRGIIPVVHRVLTLEQALHDAGRFELSLFLYEGEREYSLKRALEEGEYASIALFSGPEGGYEPAEATCAVHAGARCVTLGPRILRCETAPIAALSAVMYASGNL